MQGRVLSVVIGFVVVLAVGGYTFGTRQASLSSQNSSSGNSLGSTSAPHESINVGWGEDSESEEDDGNIPTTPVTPTTSGTGGTSQSAGGYTLAQVATHNSRQSCWSAINGNVYDLTSWIPHHPGGEQNILNICGIDGSGAFNNQHGGSSNVKNILLGFQIGQLI